MTAAPSGIEHLQADCAALQVDERRSNVHRMVRVINCFSEWEPVLSLTIVSERVGLAKSTTHRLLTSLVEAGLLMREAGGRGYQLGYQLLRWGVIARSALDLRNEALPFLRELAVTLGESAVLTVRDGMRCLYAEAVESSQPVRVTTRVGQPLDLHAGASSKVLLAFLPPSDIDDILAGIELRAFTPWTITDPVRLRGELLAIRERGYAASCEETDPGAAGVAAPVFDCHGRAAAGIGVVAPIGRLSPQRMIEVAPAVVDAARRLSLRLGSPDRPATDRSL